MNYKISMPCIKKFCHGSSRSVTVCQINMQAIVLFMELCYVFCNILVTLSSRFSQVLHIFFWHRVFELIIIDNVVFNVYNNVIERVQII
jgi:hypothetical protein